MRKHTRNIHIYKTEHKHTSRKHIDIQKGHNAKIFKLYGSWRQSIGIDNNYQDFHLNYYEFMGVAYARGTPSMNEI